MPTIDYTCPHCKHTFTKLLKKSRNYFDCPECGRTAKRRWSGNVGLIFKGTGFYRTDYK